MTSFSPPPHYSLNPSSTFKQFLQMRKPPSPAQALHLPPVRDLYLRAFVVLAVSEVRVQVPSLCLRAVQASHANGIRNCTSPLLPPPPRTSVHAWCWQLVRSMLDALQKS